MKRILTFLLIVLFSAGVLAQKSNSKEQRLTWFKNAKLGIFIHWGIYSVDGITASWPMKWKKMSWENYMKQSAGFTAKNYHPDQWAQLFKEAGARYAVLTTKHHDGFALWPTRYSKLNSVDHSPAKRDLIGPYAEAMRKAGIKVGFYFSLLDWSNKDYHVDFPRPEKTLKKLYPQPAWEKHLNAHQRFLRFMFGQLSELSHRYHPDLFWFDGDWEHPAEWWQAQSLKDSLLTWDKKVVVNGRLRGYGDYQTPEQGIPTTPPKGPWEFCMTINDHWGYVPSDTNYKPAAQIIRTFVKIISEGGNLLLDVGPKPDGTIDSADVRILKTLGAWIHRNKEAVYGSTTGLPPGHFYGPTLLSKDKKTLYLALFGQPKDYIGLAGVRNKILNIRVLGTDKTLKWVRNGGAKWKNIPGLLRIEVPSSKDLDPYVTILAVDLEGPIDIYQ
jgi:alpha-L-fucosidase